MILAVKSILISLKESNLLYEDTTQNTDITHVQMLQQLMRAQETEKTEKNIFDHQTLYGLII